MTKIQIANLDMAAEFVSSFGIKVTFGAGPWKNEFLPGLLMWRGALKVDRERCLGADDLLHEAGHLALLPSVFRRYATGNVDVSIKGMVNAYFKNHGFEDTGVGRALLQSGESEAIAWSYAAQVHLGLKPKLRLANASLDECEAWCVALSTGNHFGVHGMAASGLTSKRMFPRMLRWVQP